MNTDSDATPPVSRRHASPRSDTRRRPRELADSSGRVRPIIAAVQPAVDGGLYPAKAIIGDVVHVSADIFTDGHDMLTCEILFRHNSDRSWTSAPMAFVDNDRWSGGFRVDRLGRYRFRIRAAVDHYATWRHDLGEKARAGQDIALELQVGADMAGLSAARSRGADRSALLELAEALGRAVEAADRGDIDVGLDLASATRVVELMAHSVDTTCAATSPAYPVEVDPVTAGFSSWYEMFPRSASPDLSRAGTLADVEMRLGYVASLGFDVLYLPPLHPIGTTNRKGRDGSQVAGPGDPGSPWAIGASAGGHTTIAPELGSMEDFDRLVSAAALSGINVAMDLAFQCSPDHPWVSEHPEWFRRLPDGSIRYAENPPKRYEDVLPFDFDTPAWRELWEALREIVHFWIGRGVRVFRVDNPHTKPMRFWEWLIQAVKTRHPDVVFLAEAFTRPRVMEHLAKIGFSQSYTYFTWRNTKWELESYLDELTRSPIAEYFRPNFWPNTPDILHESLQTGLRAAFVTRLVLAATLSSNYGIFGPSFELQEHEPRATGSEEYLHSEKYEVRHWELETAGSLAPLIASVNAARRDHPALQHNRTLRFHQADNDHLIVYSKSAPGPDVILAAVNLDATGRQEAWVHLDMDALGMSPDQTFDVDDLLSGATYRWSGPDNFVALDPELPAHLFHLRQLYGNGPSER